MTNRRAQLGQWFTPLWAAQALVERHFADLSRADIACDPTCGDGAFLRAIPRSVPAFGCDIDPIVAHQARVASGRRIIVSDFRSAMLHATPTVFIGNPPFQLVFVNALLQRCFELLPLGGRAGFILPAYMLNNPEQVSDKAARWSIQAELLPRNLFGRLIYPLVFALFRKSEARTLVGLALFQEARDIEQMPAPVRETLRRGRGSVWLAAVRLVLADLGGEASLDAIYRAVEPKRPTGNQYWREKVRQTLQIHFEWVSAGRYRDPEAGR